MLIHSQTSENKVQKWKYQDFSDRRDSVQFGRQQADLPNSQFFVIVFGNADSHDTNANLLFNAESFIFYET